MPASPGISLCRAPGLLSVYFRLLLKARREFANKLIDLCCDSSAGRAKNVVKSELISLPVRDQ